MIMVLVVTHDLCPKTTQEALANSEMPSAHYLVNIGSIFHPLLSGKVKAGPIPTASSLPDYDLFIPDFC